MHQQTPLQAIREAPVSTPEDIEDATTVDPDDSDFVEPETLPEDPIINSEDQKS